MVMSSTSALFLSRGWLSKSTPASVVMSIRNGFSLPFCPLALSRGPCILNNKLDFTLAKGSSQCLVEHPIMGERAPSRICARYGVEAGGFLPATVHDTCHQQVPLRHVTPGSCLRFPSTGDPRHSTNAMTPFSRTPLNLTIALFICALSWVWRSCRSFFP